MAFRRPRSEAASSLAAIPSELLDRLARAGDEPSDLQARVELAQQLRAMLGTAGHELDRLLLGRIDTLSAGMARITAIQDELREMLQRYQLGPWHPAIYLGPVATEPPRALVLQGGARRVVGFARDVAAEGLATGDEVYLDDDRGLVVGKSALGAPPSTETAAFERALSGGRCLLRWRDELVVAEPAATLALDTLVTGDLVRWDHAAGLAFERFERQADRRYLLEDAPALTRASIGGQDDNLERLLDALTAALVDPERARRYGLGGRRTVLMVGPAGGGKTLLARIAAAELDRLSGRRVRFAVVKPAELESMWVGESERAVRELFRSLAEAATDGHAVLFLDEVEAFGRLRGGTGGRHDDKMLAALLAEIDGFADRSGIAIIAATNRKELIDPALLERLSEVEIRVGRPAMAGARRIFEIHLPAELPLAAGVRRAALLDHAVTRLYSPNADNAVATLRLRSGVARVIAARELLSGRAIAQICRDACELAWRRERRCGDEGLAACDLDDAIAAALAKLATTLTPRNCRAYLDDVPQDVDVVSVEPVVRRVPRRHAYVNAA